LITDLSTTIASNYPAGSDTPASLDDVQRAQAAFIAQLRDGTGFTAAAVTVPSGGTGRATSTTANALLAAGTTATGAHQTLAAGATTDLLVGGGTGALPAWTAATGTGSPVRGTTPTIATPVINGASTGTGVATAATASTLVMRGAAGEITGGAITSGLLTATGGAFQANVTPLTGAGVEIRYSGTQGVIVAYDRTGGAYKPMSYDAGTSHAFTISSGANVATITSTGLNSTVIGATTPAAGSFTTLTTTGVVTVGSAQNTFIDSTSTSIFRTGGDAGDFNSEAGHLVLQPRTTSVSRNIIFGTGLTTAVVRARISDTGLAVTGAISATGAISGAATSVTTLSATGLIRSTTLGTGLQIGVSTGVSSSSAVLLNGTTAASASQNWYVGLNVFATDGSYEVKDGAGAQGFAITPAGLMTTKGPLAVTGAISATGWVVLNTANTLYSQAGVGCFLQTPDASATPLTIRSSSGAIFATVSSTGLAVTGAISATELITASKGIVFPATQVASTDVNTLDDYEEGDWTPSVGGNATYTLQIGKYTKIGRIVHLRGVIQINVLGTGSVNTISGVPFARDSDNMQAPGTMTFIAALSTSVVSLKPRIATAATTIAFTGLTVAGTAETDTLNVFQNTTRVDFQITYQVP